MLFYLAQWFAPNVGALNVLSYHTVRAGGAAMTGFVLSLLLGPPLIRWLRAVKVGQFIRKDHVHDLHELHKGKAGTPTMGGMLIVVCTLVSLLLWGRLANPLLAVSVLILCLLCAVGFVDDFTKLRRKHNKGLSAKAKFAGQIASGVVLGAYLYYNPITVSATTLYVRAVEDWNAVRLAAIDNGSGSVTDKQRRFFQHLEPVVKSHLERFSGQSELDSISRVELVSEINNAIHRSDLYDPKLWPMESLNPEAHTLISLGTAAMGKLELDRFNRLLFEDAFPTVVESSQPNLHTKVNIPGLKSVFISLGPLYILFVIMIIVASSNSVNLTDGLDGLAIGASVISLMALTAIAYVVSRADWSQYLFLAYVPEASELTVFGAALLGTGLGFMWFNSHPAEVFMGDTGSLSLGGAIGTMAILTKQELLLILVGGLFVLEAASVIIQVVSFKLRGKRVFRMAPLHHHFELMGWSETKVTIRFWILAILFALLSLATLKLR
jgi:UDP-N-acetylmuramyl pentapeptide phosphotransferase/UDP-N-acetylglucosamine-1-phosphate transferase